jgi:hypothetical protein
MDLESVADELYGLLPDEFVEARGRHAAAARKAGNRELADRIGALRRPTQSAWTSNLFVRAHPDQVTRMLELGEGLRQAHRELDPEQLRALSRQRHTLVGELARQARQLAADAGHPVGDAAQQEVEATLHAVLADPQAAQEWASGRLVKPLSATGFPAIPVTGGAAAPRPEKRGSPAEETAAAEDRRREEQRRVALAQARQDSDAAEQEAQERENDLDRAESLVREAEDHADSVAQELNEAQERARAARNALDEARHRATEAGRSARRARRDADTARSRAQRLAAEMSE